MSRGKCYGVVAIIQARLTNTRLPQKVLKKIGHKTILQHTVDRVNQSMWVEKVVVASPHKIPIDFDAERFIGSENDVLDRYYKCAKKFRAKYIVRITSDCPFIDPNIIDQSVEFLLDTDHGFSRFAPIDGLDVESFTFEMLEEAWKKATLPEDREHVTPYMIRKTKLSVDTQEELEKARRWYGLHK